MNRALVVALAALLPGCHEGVPRDADESDIDHPLKGAWRTYPNDSPGRVYFHRSFALDDGDLAIFPGVARSWSRGDTKDSIFVQNVAGNVAGEIRVNFFVYAADAGETLLNFEWPDSGPLPTLQRADYVVTQDCGATEPAD